MATSRQFVITPVKLSIYHNVTNAIEPTAGTFPDETTTTEKLQKTTTNFWNIFFSTLYFQPSRKNCKKS